MEAKLGSLKDILGKNDTQFRIPNFQRKYSWKKEQYERLYEDFIEAYLENKDVFLGSLVVKQCPSYNGVSRLDVIDGQQRFTTIAILFTALRDLSGKKSKSLESNLEQYLMNTTKEGDDRFKIVAKKDDHEILVGLIAGDTLGQPDTLIKYHDSEQVKAYKFFKKELEKLGFENFDSFRDKVLEKIKFVYITLNPDEDEYIIFECLNARGTPLTQSELINNLILMSVDENIRDTIYKKYYLHWEKEADEIIETLEIKKGKEKFTSVTMLTNFLFSFYKSFDYLKENQVYSVFQKKFCEKGLDQLGKFEILDEITRGLSYYKKILTVTYPKNSENEFDRILYRIAQMDMTVCYPFLITLFEIYEHKKIINKSQFIELLKTTENYIVRNSLTKKNSTGLNRVFIELAKMVRKNPNEIQSNKIVNYSPYPSDSQLRESLVALDIYKSLKGSTLKPIFQAIEDYYSEVEKKDEWFHLDKNYQIEHICPQNLIEGSYDITDDEWKELVNSLGNLTIIKDKNNASASNKTFNEKKANYQRSTLGLNKYFKNPELQTWDAEAIRVRTDHLTQKILTIFPDLLKERKNDIKRTPSIKVYGVKIGEVEIAVNSWSDGFYKCMNYAIDDLGMGSKILQDYSLQILFTDSEKVIRTKYIEKISKYLNVNLGSLDIKKYSDKISIVIGQPIEWVTEKK